MCNGMTSRVFLIASSTANVVSTPVVFRARSDGCREPLQLRKSWCSTPSSWPGQWQFRHQWTTTSSNREKIPPRKRNHWKLTRASVFGPELSYELADQLNAWILPPPPEPIHFPRKNLNLKFAVLLMRSAYEAVDDLDFIPMNKFQVKVSHFALLVCPLLFRWSWHQHITDSDSVIGHEAVPLPMLKLICIFRTELSCLVVLLVILTLLDILAGAYIQFWKLRQSELEPYTLQYRPLKVKYGDLTDPLYFDFISFSQFATISQEIQTGEVVFQEKVGASGELQTVRRDASLVDNAKLPLAFIKRAGDLIYQRLLEGFEDQSFSAPPPLPEEASFSAIVQSVQKLLQIFVDKGYALKAVVDQVETLSNSPGGKFKVKVDGGATLWGQQTLVSRRAVVLPTFDALAVGGYLRACQRSATYKIRYSATSIEAVWTVI